MIRVYFYNLATDKSNGIIAGFLKIILFLLSLLYGFAVYILIIFYKFHFYRLSCKVISVGNITVGGTGKTVLVEHIARYLKSQGKKAAILTRGYKRRRGKTTAASCPAGRQGVNYEDSGDEAWMLSQKMPDIPVIVDEDRIRAAKKAVKEYGADTVILDDGLQQWKIKKDLEIVAIDATNPFGNKFLLPRGILRQPLSTLKCADVFVLTRTDLNTDTQKIKDLLMKLNPGAVVVDSVHAFSSLYLLGSQKSVLDTGVLKKKKVALLCGIGNPGSFKSLVENLGAQISLDFEFPDHHDYSAEELNMIAGKIKESGIDTIVTTEKDAARIGRECVPDSGLNFLVVGIALKVTENENGLRDRLLKLYSF